MVRDSSSQPGGDPWAMATPGLSGASGGAGLAPKGGDQILISNLTALYLKHPHLVIAMSNLDGLVALPLEALHNLAARTLHVDRLRHREGPING
jgi:hypothetical protein